MTATMTPPDQRKKFTHTHSTQELVFLRAATKKAAEKIKAAVTATRAAGTHVIADELQERHDELVGVEDDEGGSTVARLKAAIESAEEGDGQAEFKFQAFEARAIEIGLPLLARRLRSMQGELGSIGRDDMSDWCRDMSEHCEGVLKGHYAEQGSLL